MNPIHFLGRCAVISLFLAAIPASATNYCQDACMGMLREAHALEGQGKYQEALDKFRAAQKAEPLASLPVSSEAALLYALSGRVKPDQATAMRDAARGLANRALRLSADDPALRKMLALARDDQLEPAILLLLFRQSYRPDLDAWLAAHPGGVKAFIDRYGLEP